MKKKDHILVVNPFSDISILGNDFLKLGNVVQISPLPSLSELEQVIFNCSCPKCATSQKIKILDYQIADKIAALAGRCTECTADIFMFFSEESLSYPDITIVGGSLKSSGYDEEIDTLICPTCKSNTKTKYMKDYNTNDFARALPALIKCTNISCQKRFNTIFHDAPIFYFDLAMNIANEVIPYSTRCALVFLMSALETYLQKVFLFQSSNNRYLVEKRKLNFQRLEEVNEVYNTFLKVDLKCFISDHEWQSFCQSMTKRHGIIHNAGLNNKFYNIVVSSEEIDKIKTSLERFIKDLETELKTKGLV